MHLCCTYEPCHYTDLVNQGLPKSSLHKKLVWWVATQKTLKNHKIVKLGGVALARIWALAWDNTIIIIITRGM